MKFQIKLTPKAILSISAIIAIVMLASSFVELNQSKKEIFNLLYNHSSTLLQSIIKSSENTLNSSFEIEDLITERLLDNARMIRKLDSIKTLSRNELTSLAEENNLYRINIFDKKGNRVLTNRIPEPDHVHGEENINRSEELAPILNGKTNEFIIGLKKAEYSDEERYAVAVARANNRGAIVVNIDAKSFLEFRKKIGIGVILNGMSSHHGIEYIILQDSLGILAASEKTNSVEAIIGSRFLTRALSNDSVYSRIIKEGDTDVYEVVQRFMLNGEFMGLYRLGVSLEDIRLVEERMLRRLIIISLILAAISIIVLSIIFTNQNLKSISKEYQNFKTLTSTVLENMSEAVIVLDKNNKITLFNKSAEELFSTKAESVLSTDIISFQKGVLNFIPEIIKDFSHHNTNFEKQISINKEDKFLSFGISQLTDPDTNNISYTIVIKDLTETKRLEEDAKRNEKLSAMGELASGVAHEIRNPINAIGMIAQRLNKEFIPTSNESEYSDITKLLRKEVDRVNKIITQFLSYSKPIDLSIKKINIKSYFEDIFRLFEAQAKQKSISFILKSVDSFNVSIDPDLIKQALLNVIQNAFDAVGDGGEVQLNYYKREKSFIIEIADNGSGISTENQKKIFDLYFTTKKEGNGLGLSISQKIIAQHNGTISINSKINKGTIFKITLPLL